MYYTVSGNLIRPFVGRTNVKAPITPMESYEIRTLTYLWNAVVLQ